MTSKKMYFNLFKIAFLLSFINVSVFQIALCQIFKKNTTIPHVQTHDKTNTFSTTRPVNEARIQDTRFRRAINSEHRDKCGTASQCRGNNTLFENVNSYYNCYCDNACYETFQDCCPDFVGTCGEQKKTNTRNSQQQWKCLAVKGSALGSIDCSLRGSSGIWMIANCSRNWALDETRTRCENPSETFSYPVEDFLPLVAKNGFTYRNKHCAECNGQTSYKTWRIVVKGLVTPPKRYKLDDKLRFLLANGGYIRNIGPSRDMPRRYCAGATYMDSCFNTSHWAYQECLNGAVERVGSWRTGFFKNFACALCNEEITAFKDRNTRRRSCLKSKFSEGFSIVFTAEKQTNSVSTVNQTVRANCPEELVYDDSLEYCREGVVTNVDDTLSDVFLITLWFESSTIEISTKRLTIQSYLPRMQNINNIIKHLMLGLVKKFALNTNQLTGFQFHRQNYKNTALVATFHLSLTPYQKFILANQNNTSSLNISTKSQKFLGLLKFTTKFTEESGGYCFPVIKLVSKQLACFQGRKLQSHEYEVDHISGNVTQNTTGNVFSKNEYAILGKIGENITICPRLVLSVCHNGTFVTLYEHEYFVYENLTIFYYQTNRTLNFGEYRIIEGGSSNRTTLDIFQNASFPRNSAIAICLPLRQTFNATKSIKVVTKPDTAYPLRILTLICFTISILFIFILLVTYWMFHELRTLPGLNLMSLAVSILLSQVIWLVGTAHFMNTKTCEVLGIIEHYLFLVTFMAMSVISHRSCIEFSRPFDRSPNSTRAQFVKYSSMAWISPAIFIAVCVTLDQTEATFDIYGTTCWLSTRKVVLYLFILPATVIMLFNIVTFIKTALALSYNNNSQILQRDRKKNLIACTKLSTLIGFPWLFAFFGVIFPDTEAFEYLFVVFACLQGFYMGVAFVCNKETLQRYKNWWESRNTVSPESGQRNETIQMS